MPNLFGLDIASIVHNSLSGKLVSAVLSKVVIGTRTPGSLTSGNADTPTTHNAEGILGSLEKVRPEDRSDAATNTVLLIGNSIEGNAIPEVTDKITIEGKTFVIHKVKRDPAAATYLCQVS